MKPDPEITIVIPTLNRARNTVQAVRAALQQSWYPFTVLVIDDGSTDDTWQALKGFAGLENFAALRLARNVGTAQAKNAALLVAPGEAITFHDSDDLPERDKLLLQARGLAQRIFLDRILDWQAIGLEPGVHRNPDVVVGAYRLIKLDGSTWHIDNRISLVDDFFPNLQFPSKTPGDWCLVNAGLFRREVFARLGGFVDSVEEDRELRNRTIAAGCLYYFVDEPLLTKIEMNDSLTVAANTSLEGSSRLTDRRAVWQRSRLQRQGHKDAWTAAPIDLPSDIIADCINPGLLTVSRDFPLTRSSEKAVSAFVHRAGQKSLGRDAPCG